VSLKKISQTSDSDAWCSVSHSRHLSSVRTSNVFMVSPFRTERGNAVESHRLETINGVQIQGHVTMTPRYQWDAVSNENRGYRDDELVDRPCVKKRGDDLATPSTRYPCQAALEDGLTNGPMASFTNSTPDGASAGSGRREKTMFRLCESNFAPIRRLTS